MQTAVVVGASLAGLVAALALSRVGLRVTVLEREDADRGFGGMLMVDDGLIERLTGWGQRSGATSPTVLHGGVHAWGTIYASLRGAAELDANVDVRHHVRVVSVGQDADTAWVITDQGEHVGADIVIGADGHRSVVRRTVAPDQPEADFAGYVIWLGSVHETSLAQHLQGDRRLDEGAFQFDDRDVLFGAVLPDRGSRPTATREIGWAWYDGAHNDFLRSAGHVHGNVVHHSVQAHEIPASIYAELAEMVRGRFDSPWREVLLASIERREVTGTPIAEYVPDRLARGRVAIVGNAAHVPTPMTGNGLAASLEDAEALAAALAPGAGRLGAKEALETYARERLHRVQGLVRSGQRFSRSFRSHD